MYRRMQPRVTLVLATVWLAVMAGVVGAVTLRPLRLSHDQYSPAPPLRHGVQRDQTDWKDHGPAEDQPLDLWNGSRRSIFAKESTDLSRNAGRDLPLEESPKDAILSKQFFPPSGWQKRLPNIAGSEFAADKVDYGREMPGMLSREVPPSDPSDPFVADDTFQDQGPGSVEIYKLDLSGEKSLLSGTTPSARLPARNKSKAPKKTGRVSTKVKTTEIKSTTSPKTHHRQSNFFEEQRTETPVSSSRDAFGVGGVPELQVGCEGIEASYHKEKRSIGTSDKEKVPAAWLDVTPVTLELDYDLSYDEEGYGEMDELLKLKKLQETTTRRIKPNRGDMDATLDSDHLDDTGRPEKLPVRGDLGESIATNSSGPVDSSPKQRIDRNGSPVLASTEAKDRKEVKAKREPIPSDDDSPPGSRGRRLLWLTEANTEGFAGEGRKRAKRSTDWGFGEDEGVVSSDELQTVNERRRQHEMRHRQDTGGRDQQHRSNPDVERIRQEYEKLLEQKRREEEERLRRMQQGGRRTPDRWDTGEERRRDEMRRRQYEEYRRKTEYASTPRMDDEEARQRQTAERRRQEAARNRTQEMASRNEEAERRRREEEERGRRLQEEEELRRRPQNRRQEEERRRQEENARRLGYRTPVGDEERRQRDEEIRRGTIERQRQEEERRQEQYRSQHEAQRRREEEERRRASQENPARSISEEDRRRLEERRREYSEKRRQEHENERRRQQDRDRNEAPSNLMRAGHRVGHPNELEQRDRDRDRRMREQGERAREQQLREYVARNRPIDVNQTDRRSEEDRRRYRPEQSAVSRSNASRDDEEYRRRAEEQRGRQEEERKLQDYIRRNQPVNVPPRSNQSIGRSNWFDERRLIEGARQRGGYPDPGTARRRGPSAPTYIDPRGSLEEVRRRQEEKRLEEEERRRARERQQWYEAEERRKELTRRQREEEERKLQEERRKEAVRREEEARGAQSRMYEENRKRLEAARMQTERSRHETLWERARDEGQTVGRTRQPEATTRSPYQDPRLAEHRRRQDSRLIPSNLTRDESRRAAELERQRQEQARSEAERRRQEESRIREQTPKQTYTDQRRRQEIARLHALPVNARIILNPGGSTLTPGSPIFMSRAGFENEIDVPGINPNRQGVQALRFPAPPTSRPPAQSPGPCVWAIVHCCSRNNNRLSKCFESMGCPGISWDANPCRHSIMEAARTEVMNFYSTAENQ